MPAQHSAVRQNRNRSGHYYFEIDVWHTELNKQKTLKNIDYQSLIRMSEAQLVDWNLQWRRKQEQAERAERMRSAQNSREQKRAYQEEQKQEAAVQTERASYQLTRIQNLLAEALNRQQSLNWNRLKDRAVFAEPAPQRPPLPPAPFMTQVPPEPVRTSPQYLPVLTPLDRMMPARRDQKINEAGALFQRDHTAWVNLKRDIDAKNAAATEAYRKKLQEFEQRHAQVLAAWEQRKKVHQDAQMRQHAEIDQQRAAYLNRVPEAVVTWCRLVLSASEYPDFIVPEFELTYIQETAILLVDYWLPTPDDVPTLTKVTYNATQDEFKESRISESQRAALFDTMVYQIVFRCLYELFRFDEIKALTAISFNGYVRSIDKATGNEVTACILSLQVRREDFDGIQLARIDPKACFKQLKGVGSSKLHSVTPVAPIMQIRRDDGRFVAAHDVAYQLNEGYNLAAMDWEEFEHLIREVFAQEFSSNGGEVKVTQASRDGGVDAIAFDPDPIRGGKIVIQAKRYTNTVGVAAVRDLYGTVMNEGATKGILVTTSDYGPDSYEFAHGKPLTLLNGGNLLHLLEKHGYKAIINVQEARQVARHVDRDAR